MDKKTIIRCRAIILHEGKLLVVKHLAENTYYVLPGGHLDWGEDLKECMSRELEEELGIKGDVGRLFYINNYVSDNTGYTGKNTQSIEFFFEIKNSADYAKIDRPIGTHADEIYEIKWVGKDDSINILPLSIISGLKDGTLESDFVRFVRSNK